MGNNDIFMKRWLSDKKRFADLINGCLFQGEQVSNIKKMRKENKELKGSAEFLSGLKKEDLLVPVLTVIFYYGDAEYDGQIDLHGLLGVDRKEYGLLKKYVPNYRINLIDPKKLDDVNCFQTDLQIIFGMLKYKSNKNDLKTYVQENKSYFGKLDVDSYNAVKALLGSERYLKSDEQVNGGIDMCKALEDLYQDGVNEGMEKGIEQGLKALILFMLESGCDKPQILEKLKKDFSLDDERAEDYFVKFSK